jgi:hypothetical protein
MTKPKPKPSYSPLIEWPAEQLQLVEVTVERKAPARAGEAWHLGTDRPMAWSMPERGKITFH